MTRRIPTCTMPHPQGVVSCDAVRETRTAVFAHRICQVCGRSQGIARVSK